MSDADPPIKVLLVEDDEDDYVLTRDMLTDIYGKALELDWIDTGEAGIEAIVKGGHDVALIDFRLGTCTGLEVVREANSRGCTDPLILFTGQGSHEIDIEAMEAGATDYLVKGEITAPLLERSVRYAIERKKAEAALRESEKSIRALIETTNDSVFLLDPDGICLTINQTGAERLGIQAESLLGKNILDIMPPDVAERRRFRLDQVVQSKSPTAFEDERAGRWYESNMHPVFDEHGGISRIAVFARDITERKKNAEIIYHQANFDALTDLPNRTMFHGRFARALQRARRSRSLVALLFVDLDGFKGVNDTLGHGAGDLLLQEAALRLTSCVREVDTVARIGGDEFTIVLPDLGSVNAAERVARLVLSRLAEPFILKGADVSISGSIGITFFPDDAEDVESLLRNADSAMYRAKDAGSNAFRFFAEPDEEP